MDKKKIKKLYNSKVNLLKKYNESYFDKNKSIVPDEEYDSIKDLLPILFRENEKDILSSKNKYYTYTLYGSNEYNPSFDQILQKDITLLCKEYINSIQWTFDYYFNECISWRWYYRYHSAPFIKDLYEYMQNNKHVSQFNKQNPYLPKEQLKIVLPLQEDTYMYPEKTPLFSLLKTYYWECHPILPH